MMQPIPLIMPKFWDGVLLNNVPIYNVDSDKRYNYTRALLK